MELICTCEFFKKRNCTRRSGSCNFSFLKNSLVQINSKLNSKPYDYLYKMSCMTFHFQKMSLSGVILESACRTPCLFAIPANSYCKPVLCDHVQCHAQLLCNCKDCRARYATELCYICSTQHQISWTNLLFSHFMIRTFLQQVPGR